VKRGHLLFGRLRMRCLSGRRWHRPHMQVSVEGKELTKKEVSPF
jgi:hypothetical protein